MKKRIISLILVTVMLMLSLASCGYSLATDDLSKYSSYSKDEFDKIFESIEIEDGDFTRDEETRIKKVADSIYKQLISAAGTETIKEGAIDANDVVTYCYFAEIEVTEKDDTDKEVKKTVIVNASNMKTGSAAKLELGYSDLTDLSNLNAAIKAEITKIEKIEDYLYSTKSSTGSTYKEGDVAYISYTVKPTDKDTSTSYSNVKVILKSDADNGIHNEVVAKLLADENKKIATTVSSFENEDETKKYSNLKVNWVVNEITEGEGEEATTKEPAFLTIPVKLTEKTTFTATDATKHDVAKDSEVTYYVYLVSCTKVKELSASVILDEFYGSSITVDTLDCFANHEDLVKDYAEKIAKYKELDSSHDHSDDDKEDADAHEKMDEAKEAADKARDALIAAVEAEANGEEGTEKSDPIVDEYKEAVKESLLDAYNEEIKLNLAKVIWEKMQAAVTVNDFTVVDAERPDEIITEIYNIIYDNYEHDFYDSHDDEEDEDSAYKKHGGSFKSYLAEQTKTQGKPFAEAKNVLWEQAIEHVNEMIVIYVVAEAQGQLIDKAAIKEYKKTLDYEQKEPSCGEANTLAAYQFDLLMDYLLETEMVENEDGEEEAAKDDYGVIKYKNFKNITYKTAETE